MQKYAIRKPKKINLLIIIKSNVKLLLIVSLMPKKINKHIIIKSYVKLIFKKFL